MTDTHPPLALIPAAGRATRLGALDGSKELLAVRWPESQAPPTPAIAHLLRALGAAGVAQAVVVLRRGKWDLPERIGAGEVGGPLVTYLVVDPTPSVPHTLAAALPLAGRRPVVLGFPDILLTPGDAFAAVLDRFRRGGLDLVLGLFPADRPEKTDMVELAADGTIRRLVIKQPDQGLRFTWSLAAWGSRFTELLLARVAACPEGRHAGRELAVGDVVTAALDAGLAIGAVGFEGGRYLDIGTLDDLARVR